MEVGFLRLLVLTTGVIILAISACTNEASDQSNGHGVEKADDEFERGIHNGRLLREGSFALELKIFETGVPPQYRAYAYSNEVLIKPDQYNLSVEIGRLGKEKEIFTFEPLEDFQFSKRIVSEPHSFDVKVNATYSGKSFTWTFPSYEGRTIITDQVASRSGIETEKAQGREIRTTTRIRGKVFPSEHKIAHIIPRFPGLIKEGRKHIGDTVEKGEVIAIIESNESLQPFEVRSQIAGAVINGHVIVGEFVPQNQWIYVVADLSEVWVDFFVPLSEKISIVPGQRISLSTLHGEVFKEGSVYYVAPYADERSQSQLVRVVIPNSDNKFIPGMFVIGELVVNERKAQIAIKKSGIQRFRDWNVVFRKVKDTYEIAPIEMGISDDTWVEVLTGLESGDEYVTNNSFLIKSDILKSGATHDH